MAGLRKTLFVTLMLVGSCMVICQSTTSDKDQRQSDDYDYGSDDSTPSEQGQTSSLPKNVDKISIPARTVVGNLGENITLSCNLQFNTTNVILWYQGKKLVSQGSNIISSNFSLDPDTFDLTILKASPQSGGEYICNVLPNRSSHMKVIVVEHASDIVAPSESTGAKSSIGFAMTWLLAISCLLRSFK